MKILGIDSSGLVASVAVVEDDNMLGEFTTNVKKTHSQTLLPMLDQVMRMTGVELEELDAIAVAAGPGSFTGLRIGSTTAKGLGLALQIPLVHVKTVEGLAYNLVGASGLVCPIMDARRQQTYTGLYGFLGRELIEVIPQCAIGIDELVEKINTQGEGVTFLGDGVEIFAPYIEEHCMVPYCYAPAHINKQRAGAVAALGLRMFSEGKYETASQHRPDYLRLSQAERERQAKGRLVGDAKVEINK